MNKKVFFALTLIITAVIICACGKTADPVGAPAETRDIAITSDYEIMRAERATDNEINAAVDLFIYFRDLGENVRLMNDYDYIYFDHSEDVKWIFIGDCSYTGEDGVIYTEAAKEGLGENDYTVKIFDDGCVAIVAMNDRNIEEAVAYAISMLSSASADETGVIATLSVPVDYIGSVEYVEPEAQSFALDEVLFDENAQSDMPAMYIQLADDKKLSSIKKDEYLPATIALDGVCVFDNVDACAGFVKGRGNYSWGLAKKPYNIKFESKVDLCGMGAAKKWTLIANYSDKTLMRNYLTLSFAYDIGMLYTSQCISVNLYVNGEYNGVYLLTERVQVHEERVDIDVEQGAVLFEIETPGRHSNVCTYCMSTKKGVHMLLVEPEVDEVYTEEMIQTIRKSSEDIIQAAENSMSQGYDSYSEKIDVDSFVDWYIVSEFVKNFDSIFVTSVYGYIGNDGKVAMGPVWDFDTCMGNQAIATCLPPEGWYIADATWYKILLADDDFYRLTAERWCQLRRDGFIDRFIERIDTFPVEKAASIADNFVKWKSALYESGLRGDKSLYTYDEEVEYLRNWVVTRMEWLDEQFGYTAG